MDQIHCGRRAVHAPAAQSDARDGAAPPARMGDGTGLLADVGGHRRAAGQGPGPPRSLPVRSVAAPVGLLAGAGSLYSGRFQRVHGAMAGNSRAVHRYRPGMDQGRAGGAGGPAGGLHRVPVRPGQGTRFLAEPLDAGAHGGGQRRQRFGRGTGAGSAGRHGRPQRSPDHPGVGLGAQPHAHLGRAQSGPRDRRYRGHPAAHHPRPPARIFLVSAVARQCRAPGAAAVER